MSKQRILHVEVTEQDNELALAECSGSARDLSHHCVVVQAIKRLTPMEVTCGLVNAMFWTEDEDVFFARLPDVGRKAVERFDEKLPFVPVSFSLEIPDEVILNAESA